ncbi:MAG: PA14 domain-containing protein, partial [Verrucomicrobiota bacterium]
LTVINVRDTASAGGGNVIAAPGNTATFKSVVFAAGVVHKFWDNMANNIAALTGDARFPDSPTFVTIEPRWEYGPNGSNESGSNYGNQLSGWFVPDQSGNYIFFTNSDDPSDLYLSTDDNPANKKLIAQETGWSNARNWVSVGGGSTLENKRSDTFANSEWPTPNVITLEKGKKYYMESLHTEGGGGDSVGATFIMEQEADPANGDAPKLAGALIGSYLDPTGASVTISQAPQNTTQQELRTVTFTVTATGASAYGSTVTYQWQKAPPGSSTFTAISGATTASYLTPLLQMTDNGAKYRVICSVPTITELSAVATLTVVPDTFAPTVTGAGAILKGTAIEIGVGFDENVDATTASATANYTLSKGTVTSVRYQKYDHTDGAGFFVLGTAGPFNGSAVVLTTSGLAAGDSVTVTVKNVKDVKGNAMSATGESKTLFVTRKMKWAAMGGDDFLQGETGGGQNITADPALWPDDVVAYSEADFDLISSGSANWSNYDEATFVYEEVTGDFDKVVRVEYHDPTSQWARAGMAATPKTDEGVSRADVTGGYLMAPRYMLRANPAVQWNGTGGNNQNEADWRDIEGGNYGGTGTGTPAYPNAWLRMQRSGQVFNGFYSSDGVNWTAYGSHTYTVSDTTAEMPATLLVGIYYSPEFGNNGSGEGVGHSSVGKFRQYGSFVSNPSKVDFGIGLNFGADESDGSNSGTLPSISTAGVPEVIQANWNNLSLASGTKDNLVADIKGVAQPTTATVTWNCPNTWSSTGRGEENNLLPANDKILMTGYLDTANATTTTVTISGLPSQLTAGSYDVYVYALGGVGGRGGGYRILNAADQSVLKDYVNAQSPTNPTSYVQAIPQAGAWAVGNYMLFTGLNAPAIIVEGTTEGGHAFGGTPRGPINAVQLVKAGAVVVPPSLKAELNAAGKVVLTFEGTLQAADEVGGTYSPVAGSSPLTVDPTAARKFYRARR